MRFLNGLFLLVFVAACAEKPAEPVTDYGARPGSSEVALMAADEAPARSAPADPQQKIIRNGQLSVEVEDLDGAASIVRESVKSRGGRIESAARFSDERVHMRIRVPAEGLDSTIADASALGRVLSRMISENDVTTRYIDTEARLKTRLALRDRLNTLLETATTVEDVLNIERELARVQGEIDAMQGQLDYLDRQVSESTLDLTLQIPAVTPPETKPGPLGYVALGIWKAVKWLFVWEN
jgi:hypothetical protein